MMQVAMNAVHLDCCEVMLQRMRDVIRGVLVSRTQARWNGPMFAKQRDVFSNELVALKA